MKLYFKLRFIWTFISNCVISAFLILGAQCVMHYRLHCNSTQFVKYYKLRDYYKLQRNIHLHCRSDIPHDQVTYVFGI